MTIKEKKEKKSDSFVMHILFTILATKLIRQFPIRDYCRSMIMEELSS